tara:strand:- start:210 stop:473 length:264 start_codon:yes stop_codon:yes gene_type:complete
MNLLIVIFMRGVEIFERFFIFFFVGLLELNVALAYIDPGTGGMIAGSVWPFIVGVLGVIGGFFAKRFFKPVKRGVLFTWDKVKRRKP